MRIETAATVLGVVTGVAACGKAPADPPPAPTTSATAAATEARERGNACVKDGSDPTCPMFDGARWYCPAGWKLATVDKETLKTRCGPYEL